MRIINRENESSDNTVHRDNTTHHDNTTHRDNAAYSANTAHHDNASHHDSGCGNHSYGWTSCKGREIQTKATKTGYLVLYVFHFNLNCMNCRNAVSSRSEGRPTKHSFPPTKLTNLSSEWIVEWLCRKFELFFLLFFLNLQKFIHPSSLNHLTVYVYGHM